MQWIGHIHPDPAADLRCDRPRRLTRSSFRMPAHRIARWILEPAPITNLTSIQIRLLSEVRRTAHRIARCSNRNDTSLVTASRYFNVPVVSPDCELTVIIDWPLIVNEDGVSTRSLVSN